MRWLVFGFTLVMLFHIIIPISGFAQNQKGELLRVNGCVVAYDLGVGDFQRIILRSKNNKFYLILYNAGSSAAFPENFLEKNRKWDVPLIRKPSCDQTFEKLEYYTQMDPEGGISKEPRMKRTETGREIKFPNVAIPCYVPSANSKLFQQQKLKGVVVNKEGQPIPKTVIRLGYENMQPNYFIYTDENGIFEINILKSIKYTLYAESIFQGRMVTSQRLSLPIDKHPALLKLVLNQEK